MSEPNQETYADISDELRTLSKSSKYCELQPTVEGRPISVYFAELADRIEAAAKREETEIAAKSLAVGGIVEVPQHKPSNAAALYEVLHWVKERMIAAIYDGSFDCHEALGKIDAALSIPARNCDLRYYNNGTVDVCSARAYVDHLRYCEKYGACDNCPMNSENGNCLAKYLLSPAEGVAK